MKLLLTLLLLLTAGAAEAKCSGRNLEFWPKSGQIRPNAVFLIEGFEGSQAVVSGLGRTHQAYLQAGRQRIALDVQEVLVGQFQLTQAVLRPHRKLAVGTQYELIIVERARPAESIIWQHKYSRTYQVKYTVAAGGDHTAPTWLTRPTEKGKHYEEYGCGPALGVTFAAAVHDESAYLVRAAVRNLTSGQTTTCYLRPGLSETGPTPGATAEDLFVGHGMCSGAFELEKGTSFAVTFELLDEAGNRTPWAAAPIRFTPPAMPGQ